MYYYRDTAVLKMTPFFLVTKMFDIKCILFNKCLENSLFSYLGKNGLYLYEVADHLIFNQSGVVRNLNEILIV